jgi:hypothetical protein
MDLSLSRRLASRTPRPRTAPLSGTGPGRCTAAKRSGVVDAGTIQVAAAVPVQYRYCSHWGTGGQLTPYRLEEPTGTYEYGLKISPHCSRLTHDSRLTTHY